MKILVFLHRFGPGGVERDALRLADGWSTAGHAVHIAMGRATGPLAKEAPALPITIFEQHGARTARFETLWMIARLPALIRRLKPDILFCAGNTYSVVAVAMRLILGRECPPIVLRISNDLVRRDLPQPLRWGYHRWLRLQAPVFASIVAMAPTLRDEIIGYMGVPDGRIAVINNASIRLAEAQRFAVGRDAVARPKNGRRFLAVGRLVAQKNFALLIEAFAQIAGDADRLTIIGEGAQRGALMRRAIALGVADRIALPGHVWPLVDAFAAADAFVLSSDYEGLPAVLIEALAAGIPIVTTRSSAAIDALVEGAGIVTPPCDVAALAAAMTAIGDRAIDLPTMRARAATFTVEAVTLQWTELFEQVANQHGATTIDATGPENLLLGAQSDPVTDR